MVRSSLLALFLLGGCLSARGPECESDEDCRDQECTRPGECVPAGTSIRVVVEWTVNGDQASDQACAPIGDLGVFFYDEHEEAASYVPVPCPLGRATYDKMPPRFDQVALVAYDDSGDAMDRVERDLEPTGETVVAIDLQP